MWRFSRFSRARAPSSWSIETQVSVTTASAPRTAASGSVSNWMRAPSRRAQASTSSDGRNGSGHARRSSNANLLAAWIHETATLLPSPVQVTTLSAIEPFFSSNVITSAITWHGCERSVRPLITGTEAWRTISSRCDVLFVRSMIASQ